MKTLLFDYGGTLDTAARHWNFVLLDGFRHAAQTEPALKIVDGRIWRDAYVFGERALAKSPIVQPTDNFHTLLVKKVRLELQYLMANMVLMLSPEAVEYCTNAVADYCDAIAQRHVNESRTVLETLRQRGYRFVLVTNFYGNISTVLRSYGLAELFPTIVESATVGVRKPDPTIWKLGAEAADTTPDNCTAIGDSFSKDIVAAKDAGCNTIWFKGKEWEEKRYDETIPSHIITALPQLLDILP